MLGNACFFSCRKTSGLLCGPEGPFIRAINHKSKMGLSHPLTSRQSKFSSKTISRHVPFLPDASTRSLPRRHGLACKPAPFALCRHEITKTGPWPFTRAQMKKKRRTQNTRPRHRTVPHGRSFAATISATTSMSPACSSPAPARRWKWASPSKAWNTTSMWPANLGWGAPTLSKTSCAQGAHRAHAFGPRLPEQFRES